MEKIYVIAGNFDQFRHFRSVLEKKMIKEGLTIGHNSIIYIGDVRQTLGMRDIYGYKIGAWYARQDIAEIETRLKQIDSFENFIEVGDDF